MSVLKDVRKWTKKMETGNIVSHVRYDEPEANRSTYVTTTYRPDLDGQPQEPIVTYRQGVMGRDELPTVGEFEFQNFDALEAAMATKTRGQQLAAAHRPNFGKGSTSAGL